MAKIFHNVSINRRVSMVIVGLPWQLDGVGQDLYHGRFGWGTRESLNVMSTMECHILAGFWKEKHLIINVLFTKYANLDKGVSLVAMMRSLTFDHQ